MAAFSLLQFLSCPLCSELYTDPVFLSCRHSFCQLCVENLKNDKHVKTCPICQKNSKDLQPNLAMRKLVQTFMKHREKTVPASEQISPSALEPQCLLHSEKLSLFRVGEQDLACVVCRDSGPQSFRSIEEAAPELREKLRSNITLLQERLKVLDQRRSDFDSAAAHVSAQAQQTQKQIRDQFDRLHQFLREEEESRMKTLKEEEEQKTQRMKDTVAAVSRDMETLSQTISETEESLRRPDVSFLLQYRTAEEKLQRCPLFKRPTMEPGALIDQAKHLGNLGFNIWRNMKSLVHFYPVVLDPNTAATHLVLSEDLSSARRGPARTLPQNPERRWSPGVKGSEMFFSGTRSWEVEVGGSRGFEAGVLGFGRVDGDGEGAGFSPPYADKSLSVKKLGRVRVTLDCDSKTLTFTDPESDTELHTETYHFTGGLTPFFNQRDDVPLKILPKDIIITV